MSNRDAMATAYPYAQYLINTQTDQRMIAGEFVNEQPIPSPPPPPSVTTTQLLMGV